MPTQKCSIPPVDAPRRPPPLWPLAAAAPGTTPAGCTAGSPLALPTCPPPLPAAALPRAAAAGRGWAAAGAQNHELSAAAQLQPGPPALLAGGAAPATAARACSGQGAERGLAAVGWRRLAARRRKEVQLPVWSSLEGHTRVGITCRPATDLLVLSMALAGAEQAQRGACGSRMRPRHWCNIEHDCCVGTRRLGGPQALAGRPQQSKRSRVFALTLEAQDPLSGAGRGLCQPSHCSGCCAGQHRACCSGAAASCRRGRRCRPSCSKGGCWSAGLGRALRVCEPPQQEGPACGAGASPAAVAAHISLR